MDQEIRNRIKVVVQDMIQAAEMREPEIDTSELVAPLYDAVSDAFASIIQEEENRADRAAAHQRKWADNEATNMVLV